MSEIRDRVDEFTAVMLRKAPKHWNDVQEDAGADFQFMPILHFLGRDGTEYVHACPMQGPEQKDLVARFMAYYTKATDAIAVAMLTEAWTATDDGTNDEIRFRSDRQEILMLWIETVFACHTAMWHIKRPEGRAPELDEVHGMERSEGRFFGAIEKLN